LNSLIIFSDALKKKEIKLFVNNKEVINESTDQLNIISDINDSDNISYNVREISVENIPTSLTNEKLYEIFFIYGDITKIQILKQEVNIHINLIYIYKISYQFIYLFN
jgi:hypothetical protein